MPLARSVPPAAGIARHGSGEGMILTRTRAGRIACVLLLSDIKGAKPLAG
jgi:hypothetical protein